MSNYWVCGLSAANASALQNFSNQPKLWCNSVVRMASERTALFGEISSKQESGSPGGAECLNEIHPDPDIIRITGYQKLGCQISENVDGEWGKKRGLFNLIRDVIDWIEKRREKKVKSYFLYSSIWMRLMESAPRAACGKYMQTSAVGWQKFEYNRFEASWVIYHLYIYS